MKEYEQDCKLYPRHTTKQICENTEREWNRRNTCSGVGGGGYDRLQKTRLSLESQYLLQAKQFLRKKKTRYDEEKKLGEEREIVEKAEGCVLIPNYVYLIIYLLMLIFLFV